MVSSTGPRGSSFPRKQQRGPVASRVAERGVQSPLANGALPRLQTLSQRPHPTQPRRLPPAHRQRPRRCTNRLALSAIVPAPQTATAGRHTVARGAQVGSRSLSIVWALGYFQCPNRTESCPISRYRIHPPTAVIGCCRAVSRGSRRPARPASHARGRWFETSRAHSGKPANAVSSSISRSNVQVASRTALETASWRADGIGRPSSTNLTWPSRWAYRRAIAGRHASAPLHQGGCAGAKVPQGTLADHRSLAAGAALADGWSRCALGWGVVFGGESGNGDDRG